MVRLRLFSADDPSRQLDARMVGADPLTVGRDASADWVIADPDRALSRKHCIVRLVGDELTVRDTSANGTFVDDGERIAVGSETVVRPGSAIRIGGYRLVIEALSLDAAAPAASSQAPPGPASLSFEPPSGMKPADRLSRPARVDPFASALLPDPLIAGQHAPEPGSLGRGDSWDDRPKARAGDWEMKPHQRGHEDLIGAPPMWSEPPRPERDGGFGFDAPFSRPMLAPVSPVPGDIAIPADWDAGPVPTPPSSSSPPPPPPAAEPPRPPALPPAAAVPEQRATPPLPVAEPDAPVPPSLTPPEPAPGGTTVARPPRSDPEPATAGADQALFDAFCAGARLSPAAFAGEDHAAAMVRLGEIYRQMVLGLADLMGERTALKNEYRMTRTMVRPDGNNPFKWAPPQRLAIEVLRGGTHPGFAKGEEAVNEAFRDIKLHILCMLAGLRAAIATTMEALSPADAESRLGGKSFLLKTQRDAALWNDYVERFDRFSEEADDSADSIINRAFRTAYERQLGELLGFQAGYDGGPASGSAR